MTRLADLLGSRYLMVSAWFKPKLEYSTFYKPEERFLT